MKDTKGKHLRRKKHRHEMRMFLQFLCLVAVGIVICSGVSFACNNDSDNSEEVKLVLAGLDIDGTAVINESYEKQDTADESDETGDDEPEDETDVDEVDITTNEANSDLQVVDGIEVEIEEDHNYIVTEQSLTVYATTSINVRSGPGTEYEVVGYYAKGKEITVTGECQDLGWYQITYNDTEAYVSEEYVTETAFKTYNGISEGDVISGEITHYCSCSICCGKSDGITASGVKAYDGIVACNWLPLGTRILIDGVEYLVADRGGSSLSTIGRVDVYTSLGHQAALEMGRQNVTIVIVSLP